ncbi:DUF7159 family protein [Mycobacterium sp. 94-17]|uniref:DUF7159 family protein n=1 Tax=Mycobacterium sp. 94-17 TaxID=2986147 RepID=UPI002D1F7D7B|nr:hypothetical protein [Mycobacterium sp. 94-17]MEB4208423.1 hypothetical protein [Mycobacterium sp. 94-17]
MDVVLGVSMAPESVHMVLVEGEAADGVTVDQDGFTLLGNETPTTAADHVVAAILGTRESAAQGGYRLRSSAVSCTDPAKAAALRNALAASRIDNVMLVSAVVAAAALAQAMGSATRWARTALLLVEPTGATLAVVDSSDGTLVDTQRHPLPRSDDAALAKLTAMVSGAESMRARPDGVFLVGSEVDIRSIKPTLEAATALSVTTPEEPEMALARGAALAAANAMLGAPRTVSMPAAQTSPAELAYSAEDGPADRLADAATHRRRSRKPTLTVAAVAMVCIGGIAALALALAVGIRPHADQRPAVGRNVVAPQTPHAGLPGPSPPSGTPAAPPPAPPSAPQPSPHSGDHQRWDDWLHRHLGSQMPSP